MRLFSLLDIQLLSPSAVVGTATAYGVFERELEAVRLRYGFVVAGYVLMPEHVHLLVGEPSRSALSVALQVLKQQTSRKLKAARRDAVLAAPLLRFQRVERREASRETCAICTAIRSSADWSPNPKTGRGRASGTMRPGRLERRDRIAMDSAGVVSWNEKRLGEFVLSHPSPEKSEGWGTLGSGEVKI